MTNNLLIGDLFCGAGGSSTGAVLAVHELGRDVTLCCVNHWPVAIETHRKNHPEARHYVEDLSIADPVKIVTEGYLDLLMASPECTGFSRARGGKPTNNQTRMNPWAVINWLTKIDVRCLLIENVPEFIHWGPLLDNGKPDPKQKGMYFQAWFNAIRDLGYKPEWRYLNAADYGDATTRIRFFMIARKDGKPVRWPSATHSPDGGLDMLGQLPKWRAAREIIDWDNPGRSLLDDPRYLKKPLSEKTMKRIARGLEKFGGQLAPLYIQLLGLPMGQKVTECHSPEPFIMGKQSSPAYRSMDEPIPTITTDGKQMLIEPVAKPFILNQNGDNGHSRTRDIGDPTYTATARGAGYLVEPMMIKYYGGDDVSSIDVLVPTVTTKDRFGLVTPTAFIVQNRIRPDGDRVYDLEKPINTVTGHGAGALVNPVLVELNHANGDGRARPVDEPLKTLTTKQGTALITPFMVQWDNKRGNSPGLVRTVDKPTPTIITKQNTGIVEPIIEAVKSNNINPRRLVLINGELYYLDLRFRMLENLELARAMGFSDNESTYEFVGNKSEITKQIGNAVPVHLAKALVKEILA